MIKKNDLFENIRDYSPQEIASAIRDGVVTLYELKKNTNGQFTPMMQLEVRNILENESEIISNPELTPQPMASEPQDLSTPAESSTSITEFPHADASESLMPTAHVQEQSSIEFEQTPISLQSEPQIELEIQPLVSEPIRGVTDNAPMSNLMPCPSCNHMISQRAIMCPKCEYIIAKNEETTDHQHNVMQVNNVMTMGEPGNLRKFSWGGFAFGWIWGVCNGVYWSLLQFIPIVNLIVVIMLGVVGRRSAWTSKKWDSVQAFEDTQDTWDTAGIIAVFVVYLVIIILGFVFFI